MITCRFKKIEGKFAIVCTSVERVINKSLLFTLRSKMSWRKFNDFTTGLLFSDANITSKLWRTKTVVCKFQLHLLVVQPIKHHANRIQQWLNKLTLDFVLTYSIFKLIWQMWQTLLQLFVFIGRPCPGFTICESPQDFEHNGDDKGTLI